MNTCTCTIAWTDKLGSHLKYKLDCPKHGMKKASMIKLYTLSKKIALTNEGTGGTVATDILWAEECGYLNDFKEVLLLVSKCAKKDRDDVIEFNFVPSPTMIKLSTALIIAEQ